MAKVYVVYFDYGYDGYSGPEAAFSEKEKAETWVNNLDKTRYHNPSNAVIDELEVDVKIEAEA